jgi:hypothetical protein
MTSPSTSPTTKKSVFGAFERRRGSSGSPRNSTNDERVPDAAIGASTTSPVTDKQELGVPADENQERRGSISNFFKKVF